MTLEFRVIMDVRGDPTNLHKSSPLQTWEAIQRSIKIAEHSKESSMRCQRGSKDIYGPITVQVREVSEWRNITTEWANHAAPRKRPLLEIAERTEPE